MFNNLLNLYTTALMVGMKSKRESKLNYKKCDKGIDKLNKLVYDFEFRKKGNIKTVHSFISHQSSYYHIITNNTVSTQYKSLGTDFEDAPIKWESSDKESTTGIIIQLRREDSDN